MKKHFAVSAFIFLMLGMCSPSALAQASGTVKGVAKDAQGNPLADAVVVYANQDNGQKYNLKTNKKGEYFSLGLTPGQYNVTLYKNADDAKANKELFHFNKFQVALDENTLDFDLKKQAEDAAKGQGLTPEQVKQMQEAQEKQKKECREGNSPSGRGRGLRRCDLQRDVHSFLLPHPRSSRFYSDVRREKTGRQPQREVLSLRCDRVGCCWLVGWRPLEAGCKFWPAIGCGEWEIMTVVVCNYVEGSGNSVHIPV